MIVKILLQLTSISLSAKEKTKQKRDTECGQSDGGQSLEEKRIYKIVWEKKWKTQSGKRELGNWYNDQTVIRDHLMLLSLILKSDLFCIIMCLFLQSEEKRIHFLLCE